MRDSQENKKRGALSPLAVLLRVLHALGLDFQKHIIKLVHDAPELGECRTSDAMITGICAQCLIGDRHLAAERTKMTVISERIEGAKIEGVPFPRVEALIDLLRGRLEPFLFRGFIGQLLKPAGVACRLFARQPCAESGEEFPSSALTNFGSNSVSLAAQVSTA